MLEGGILLNKNILAIGIVFLFIVSAPVPMTFGYKVKTSILSNNGNTLYLGGSGSPPVANFSIQNDSEIGVASFDGSLSYDLDGEIVSYKWDYGDGTTDEGMYGWHQFCDCKTYYVTLTVTDNHGLQDILTKSVEIVLVNCPPPSVMIDGPNYGNPGVEYVYTFFVCDAFDETDYFLLVDWGDGETTGWIDIPMLCEPVYLKHSWSEKGIYTIRAKAKDYCRLGPWELFEVTMPRSRATYNTLFLRFLEQFPLLERLLSLIRV